MKKPTYEEIENARSILKASGIIDAFWHIDDIISRGPELFEPRKITVKQARKIADLIARRHDANIGINWEVIDIYIQEYFDNKS